MTALLANMLGKHINHVETTGGGGLHWLQVVCFGVCGNMGPLRARCVPVLMSTVSLSP